MTTVPTSTPVNVEGHMPATSDPAGRKFIEGVYDKLYLNKTTEFDFAERGLVATPKGTTIPELQEIIHEWAVRKEWRGPNAETQRTTGDDVALIISEAIEALEAYRVSGEPSAVWYTYTVEVNGVKFKDLTIEQLTVLLDIDDADELDNAIEELGLKPKPEGVGPELADTVIRILDYCAEHDLNLLHFIIEKMAHNDAREVRHGGQHL